ncbi:hypothetical protein [Deinococcus sp. UYEF24]
MKGRPGRVARLEGEAEARRREQAEGVPLRDAPALLCDMLRIIGEEAGPEAADRVAVRAVPRLEALARWAGVRL